MQIWVWVGKVEDKHDPAVRAQRIKALSRLLCKLSPVPAYMEQDLCKLMQANMLVVLHVQAVMSS